MWPILLIDDNPDHQFLTFAQLQRSGFDDIRTASNLEEASSACADRAFQVAIVDSSVFGDDLAGAVAILRKECPGARLIGYSSGPTRTLWADAHLVKGESAAELL